MVEATAEPPAGQERVPTPAPAERGEPAKLISERGPLEDAIRLKLAQPLAPGDPAPKRDGYPYVAPLRELCVEVVAQNFVRDPRAIREPGLLDAKCVKKIVDVLPSDLPLELAGELVADEDYWQRRAEGRWEPPLETVDHGRSWKQLYFERNLQEAIEAHVAKASTSEEDEDPARDALRRLLAFSKRWARSLKIVHAPGAVDLAALFECTAGSLVSLDLKYIARDVRDNYDGANTLGMRLGCARALAKALEEHAETLTHLGLSQNSIDDAKLEPLAEGLATNASVTSLDLSKNKIGCDGARVLARVLAKDACVVSRLDLGDNEIGASGANALAKAVAASASLTYLSLRLNPKIGDEAGAAVLDAVTESGGTSMRELDVSACGLGPKSARALARLLRNNRTLRRIDASGNETLGAGDAGRAIADAVCGLNDAVLEFDVRGSGFGEGDVARITDKTLDNAEAEEEREGEREDSDLGGRILRVDWLQDIAQS